MQLTDDDDLLDTIAAAKLLGVQPSTMRNWRTRGQGPKYVRVGSRTIRYARSALTEFAQYIDPLEGTIDHELADQLSPQ